MIFGDFIFHGVGQGLFYSAKLYCDKNNRTFNFVYDCGTLRKKDENRLETAINGCNFNDGDENIIHALFISHFHMDHISGVTKLLRQYQICNIFIPYFSPEELLLLCIENDVDINSDLFELYRNPVAYFSETSNANIFIIDPNLDDTHQFDNMQESNMGETGELNFRGNIHSRRSYNGNTVYNCNSLFIQPYHFEWILKIYQDQDKHQQKNIQNQIRALYADLYGESLEVDFVKALQDKLFVEKAKKLYDKVQGRINQSSLVLYHAPTENHVAKIWCNNCKCHYCLQYYNNFTCATLLVGDINLNKLREKGNSLKDFIDNTPTKVGFFQIPHHGSEHNTSINLMQKVFPHPMEMVCCYGRRNRFHHPDAYMLDRLMQDNCGNIHHVTEGRDFTYHFNTDE